MNKIKNSFQQTSSLLCNFDQKGGLQVPFIVQKVRDDIQDDTYSDTATTATTLLGLEYKRRAKEYGYYASMYSKNFA